ncbi:biopolymer transporter ExbD [Haloferula sp. BvORR071]|uniref:ExbD/TolR family protein n=1 Tax=Haloferula sp. BvORR071 TaxID=1396141 RepID=UPI00069600FD|nr:biopolymer transporter ExbD [Haloferula sp. BvORR071]
MPVKLQGGGDDHEDDARIEIVPLIDIMFFLLASFMMVSLSMTQIHRVNVKLPNAATSDRQIKVPPVHLAVDAHGVVTWDAKIVTPTEVTERLLALPPSDENRVMIAADGATMHAQVLAVMDAVRAAKIDKISFETKNPAR